MQFNRAINSANALIGGVAQVKTAGMQIGTNPDFDKLFGATLDWWREAGIDNAFADEPRSWLPAAVEPADPAAPSGKSAALTQLVGEPAPASPAFVLPETLDDFHGWWMSTPDLDGGRVSGRVGPRGVPSPAVMIIAPMPESSDREHLLAGPEGKMVDMFLALAGLDEQRIYRASALPCHSPGADWSPDTNGGPIAALAHHIALVKPERLLVLGFNVLPLLRHSSAQGPAVSSHFNHEGATIPMLAVRRIPAVASQPRWKSVLWRAWLDWNA
jgi:DNA polymerase